jgi:hypothetical protein
MEYGCRRGILAAVLKSVADHQKQQDGRDTREENSEV